MHTRTLLLALVALLLAAVPAAADREPTAQESRKRTHPGTECHEFARKPVVGDKRGVDPAAPNPLLGETWYVDTKRSDFGHKGFREPAYGEYSSSRGRTRELLGKIALQPRFFWFGRWSGDSRDRERPLADLRKRVCTYLADAERAGAVPLITAMRHQGRECNPRYKAGGAAEDRATRLWFETFAQSVGDSRAVIAFEPDSVGTVRCLAKSRRDDRIRLLRYGIDVLSQLPNATIYIEAGASDWESVGRVAKKLRRIGVHKVRGFMLNVTHFDWTNANVAYGTKLSRRLGGKHFIVNTASNGRGPVHFRRRQGGRNRRIVINCHPLRRGVGPAPTTNTHSPLADAFMWISRPGYSSGSCNGGPRVGDWWRARALEMARYGTSHWAPRKGSRFGFRRGRFTPKQLAGTQWADDKFDTASGPAFR